MNNVENKKAENIEKIKCNDLSPALSGSSVKKRCKG